MHITDYNPTLVLYGFLCLVSFRREEKRKKRERNFHLIASWFSRHYLSGQQTSNTELEHGSSMLGSNLSEHFWRSNFQISITNNSGFNYTYKLSEQFNCKPCWLSLCKMTRPKIVAGLWRSIISWEGSLWDGHAIYKCLDTGAAGEDADVAFTDTEIEAEQKNGKMRDRRKRTDGGWVKGWLPSTWSCCPELSKWVSAKWVP